MEPISLVIIAGGAALGWYKLLGATRHSPLRWRWFSAALGIALVLSFLPGAASQGLSYNWLFSVAAGAYFRAVRTTGRLAPWRTGTVDVDEQHSPAPSTARSPVSARRAILRWSRRLFRREWRQHLIVVALITTAVAGTVIGSGVADDAALSAQQGFGTANHLVQLSGADPHLADDLAALRARFGAVDVIENQGVNTGLSQGAQLREQNPDGPYGAAMLTLVSGRYPSDDDQVAMTESLAATFGVHVGSTWSGNGRDLDVVGIVENPQNLADAFALLAPGQVLASDAETVTVLFDASGARLAARPLPDAMRAQSPPPPAGITPAVIVLAVAILALTFVALIAVGGFAALARRRRRALGMLAALGATDRDLRMVVMADGVMTGLVGAVAGTGLGLAGWIAYVPSFSISAGHLVSWHELPWWLVGCVAVLAVAASTAAAWRPARAVASLPIVVALSGRPSRSVTAIRSATPALILLTGAAVLLATSGGWGAHGGRDAVFQLAGLLLSALGLALAAPFLVARLSGPARRMPPAARLALRDLSRYRDRSGAALAAGGLAVLIAMLVTLITTGRYSDPVDYFGPNLPANQLVVYAPNDGPGTGRGPNGGSAQQNTVTPQQHADAIAATLGSHDVLALEPIEADLVYTTAQHTNTGDSGSLYLATPAVLARYGIDPSSISPTTMLVTSRSGLAGLSGLYLLYGDFQSPNGPTYERPNPSVQTLAALPTGTSDPNLLVTEYAVRTLGLTVEPTSGWLIQTPQPLSATQINTARQAALAAGMTVETRSEAPSLGQVREDATAAGIAIALGVLAMMVGLIRAESSGDLRTLAALGASARTHRNITAATAFTLALLAALAGTAIAYLDTAAFFGSELIQRMSEVPTQDLLLTLIGLPTAAGLGGWLFAGREPTYLARTRTA
jgi:putative ABC transport system permease protein